MDKETLYSIQKRPIKVLKETYHSVKRDFLHYSTRPTYNTPKETYNMPKETYHPLPHPRSTAVSYIIITNHIIITNIIITNHIIITPYRILAAQQLT